MNKQKFDESFENLFYCIFGDNPTREKVFNYFFNATLLDISLELANSKEGQIISQTFSQQKILNRLQKLLENKTPGFRSNKNRKSLLVNTKQFFCGTGNFNKSICAEEISEEEKAKILFHCIMSFILIMGEDI